MLMSLLYLPFFTCVGDGWSARFEDSILHGCIPVVIMDEVDPPLASALDLDAFSLRIAQEDLDKVPQILQAVPPDQVESMQRAVRQVWNRFAYTGYKPYLNIARSLIQQRLKSERSESGKGGNAALAAQRDFAADDAFATILQVLHSRMLEK